MRFPGLPTLPDPRQEGWIAFFTAFLLREDHRLRQGWRILLFLVAVFLLRPLVDIPVGLIFHGGDAPAWVSALLAAGTTLVVSWGFLAVEGRPLASLGLWLGKRWLRQSLAGIVGGLLLAGVPALALTLAGAVQWQIREVSVPRTLGAGLLFAVSLAFSQELFARGYVFQRLIIGLGRWPAQAVLAVSFLYLHGMAPALAGSLRLLDLVTLVLASLTLGEAWIRTQSLALPFGLHAGWTLAQGTLLGFAAGGRPIQGLLAPSLSPSHPAWLTGGASGVEASLPGVLTMALALGVLLLLPRRQDPFRDPDYDEPTRIF